MKNRTAEKIIVILIHALVIWGLCGATMMIGPKIISMETTLIVHAIGAPVFAFLVSWIYFRKFHFTKPLATAIIFTCFIIAVDAGLVAPVFEKSFEMFTSALGTWIPFTLIFFSTLLTGVIGLRKSQG